MWIYNQEDIEKEVGGGNFLDKSGCYEAVMKEFEIKQTSGGATQAIIKLETEGAETTVYHIYTDKVGNELDWKVRHLNHLLYLTKKTKIKDVKELIGQSIGVFLKAKLSQDGKYINFDLEGFYHIGTKKTAKELKENLEGNFYNKMLSKYEKEKPLVRTYEEQDNNHNKSADSTEHDFMDDEFPF